MDRAIGAAFGLTFVAWSVLGPVLAAPTERFAPPQLTLSALQLVVGVLLLVRSPLRERAKPLELAAAAPSVLASGAAFGLARPLSDWPLAAEFLFAGGALGAVVSLLFLGRCFAILPGARGVVARGPYRLVRHPAYLFELVMVGGAAIAAGWPLGPIAVAAVLVLVVVRIVAEERALRRLEDYRTYAAKVRFRLLPPLW